MFDMCGPLRAPNAEEIAFMAGGIKEDWERHLKEEAERPIRQRAYELENDWS